MNDGYQSSFGIPRLHTPLVDLAELSDWMGQAWGVSKGERLPQYLYWTECSGLFDALKRLEGAQLETLSQATILTEEATDALLRILLCLKLVRCFDMKKYFLTDLSEEYLDPTSPYYLGPALYAGCEPTLPSLYLKEPPVGAKVPFSSANRSSRVLIQHARNFAPAVVAARSSALCDARHLIDIGGGSGVFAIPLALDNPHMRITLVDLPKALDEIRDSLRRFGIQDRIDLIGMDVLASEWTFPPADAILFANVFHSQSDGLCHFLAQQSFNILLPNGSIWIHEVLFDQERNGPLLAALWNANMLSLRSGARQRTYLELNTLLRQVGFDDCTMQPTAGHFSLLRAVKPATSFEER